MMRSRSFGVLGAIIVGLVLSLGSALPSWAATTGISGTVTNGSSQADARVYLEVYDSGGNPTIYGTSIASPGAYTIQGVPDGNYTVRAFLDVDDVGVPVSIDPLGESAPFTVTGGVAANADVALADNAAASPTPPSQVNATPGDGFALVSWNAPRDQNSFIPAETYNLYWGTSSDVGPGNSIGSITGITVSDSNDVAVTGLTNGTTYYFAVTGVLQSTESSVATSSATLVGNPAGGHSLSGTVSFTGTPPTVGTTILVGARDLQTGSMFLTKMAYASTPQAFTIPGVADGTYAVVAAADLNGDSRLDTGDLMTDERSSSPVTVAGADVSGSSVTLVNANSLARINLDNQLFGSTETYSISGQVSGQVKRPVAVTLTDGPNLTVPIDIGLSEDGGFQFYGLPLAADPSLGDTYTFSVTYNDDTTENVTGDITEILSSFPTSLTPFGPSLNATMPTLSWQAPVTPPSFYTYNVQVSGPSIFWTDNDLPSSTTSVSYTGTALTLDTTYQYQVQVTDFAGNSATQIVEFAPVTTLPNNLPNKLAVFRAGKWYIDSNGNGVWDPGTDTLISSFGQSGDLPIIAANAGSGNYVIGVFRAGTWYIDSNGNHQWDSGVDLIVPSFGQAGDIPVLGNWNGSSAHAIGVFRAGKWYVDTNDNGKWDQGSDSVFTFGQAGDTPVVGDWASDGKADIGVFRAGKWYLDTNGNHQWDSGVDVVYSFGQAGDIPVVGDWNNDGKLEIGVFRAGKWYLDTNGNGQWDSGVDTVVSAFGQSGDIPVVAH